MAFSPIALTIPEYDRNLFKLHWLKAFEQGTVIPLAMATDATGLTTASRFQLDTQGFPITAGDARLIPFIDGTYDLWLFPTAAEADANDTSNAIQFADKINADPLASATGFVRNSDFTESQTLTDGQTGVVFSNSIDDGQLFIVGDLR